MKIKSFLFCLSFVALNIKANAQQNTSAWNEAKALQHLLNKNHYESKVINDVFSEQVFKKFINTLDPRQLYFTATDFVTLSVYKYQIDNELLNNKTEFITLATSLYRKRLEETDKRLTEILAKPFNFHTEEILQVTKKDTFNFALNEKEQMERWGRWLKYQTLRKMFSYYGDSIIDDKLILAKEEEARKKILAVQKRSIKRILENSLGYGPYITNLFYNAIASCYDPHSVYMTKSEWEGFQSALSADEYSFGIDLDENESGEVFIARLTPGGPAWKSNELHKNDILLELKWLGQASIDLTGAEQEEIETLFAVSSTKSMELTVKKSNGMIVKVVLKKEKIRNDENIVKSFILKGPEVHIGYISLPGFYTEWENTGGFGCANDVAKEIIKLKEEGIDGLILDIRYNGGGSLKEGADLAGIFIDEGPLLVLQDKNRKPYIMKDMNRGTVYDGPLVLMINGQSASASEVLASTLQDYKRALVVGSNSYGKATGQNIFPIDTVVGKNGTSRGGYLKVTTLKLYRVTGKSIQLKGVQPDIVLPDVYDHLDYKESSYPYALSPDSIVKKIFYTPLSPLPIDNLKQKSNARISADKNFQQIKKVSESPLLKNYYERKIPLSLAGYKKYNESFNIIEKSFEMIDAKSHSNFEIINTSYDIKLLEMDTSGAEINQVLIQNMQKDIYLQESFLNITDLINLNTK